MAGSGQKTRSSKPGTDKIRQMGTTILDTQDSICTTRSLASPKKKKTSGASSNLNATLSSAVSSTTTAKLVTPIASENTLAAASQDWDGDTEESQMPSAHKVIEGTPELDIYYPGGHSLETPPKPSSTPNAPPAYVPSLHIPYPMGDSGPASEDPVFLYLEKVEHFAHEAAIAYTTCRKRNHAQFERLAKDNAAMASTLRDENATVQKLKQELEGMKDRIQDAADLEAQNSQLSSSILALREELAKAESEVNELHKEIVRVAENYTKKSRKSVAI